MFISEELDITRARVSAVWSGYECVACGEPSNDVEIFRDDHGHYFFLGRNCKSH